jgi:glucose uptake protein GlcU
VSGIEAILLPTAVTILLWGSYLAPSKKSSFEPEAQIFLLAVGNAAFATLAFLSSPFTLTADAFLHSFIAGLIWAVGGIAAFFGIKHLGLTRGPGIWIPGKTISSFLIGIAIFGELISGGVTNLLLAIVSLMLLVVGMAIIILNPPAGSQETKVVNIKTGLLAALAVIVFWSVYLIPLKMLPDPAYSKVLPMSIGMLIGTSLLGVRKLKEVRILNTSMATFSGVIWGIANYTSLIMFDLMGVSRGFAISQLALVVNTLWGIFIFREITDAKTRIKILFGLAIALIGGIILSLSKL